MGSIGLSAIKMTPLTKTADLSGHCFEIALAGAGRRW
jgi:hypothetical protein